MKSRIALSVGFVLLLATTAAAQDMPPTVVAVEPVIEMEFFDQVTLVGRSESVIESDLVAEVTGRVEAIVTAEGTAVGRSTALLRIDDERFRLSLQAAAAEATQAEAEAKLAADQLRRSEDLFAQNLISQSAIDSARAWATIQQANYELKAAERDRLQLDVDRCVVRAPYDGYTGRRLINVGEWVTPGTPVFELANLNRMRIQVDLPERFFGRVVIGNPVSVQVSGDTSVSLEGKVTGVSPTAIGATHTFPVFVEIDNTSGRIGSGMLVRARVALDNRFTSMAVHKDALVRQGENLLIYAVNEGTAVPIPVITTSTQGEYVAVTSPAGLQPGMPVVIRGNERIFPGAPVQILGEGGGTGGPGQSPPTEEASENVGGE